MDDRSFYLGLAARLAVPQTDWFVNVSEMWNRMEGMPLQETWNPFATTQPASGFPNNGLNMQFNIGYGPGRWNNANAGGNELYRGVKVFDSPESGIEATAQTIQNGYYPNLIRCLQDNDGYDEAISDLTSWVGSYAYGAQLVQFMKDTAMGMTPAEKDEMERIKRVLCEWGVPGNLMVQDMNNTNLWMYVDQLNTVVTQLKAALSAQGIHVG